MAVSGWFITSMALAGAAQVSMNYFTPAAIIRGAAILRTGGRYLERLVTHEATLKLLARLRCWFYEALEPLAPAALQHHHSGDLLSRIRADIDTLDNLYLRLLVPAGTAFLATTILTLFLASYSLALAGVLLTLLLTAGVATPLITSKLGRKPGERKVSLLAEQRSLLVDSTQGMGELLLYGAVSNQLQGVNDNSQALAAEQARLSGINGLSQAALLFCANLALWLILWLAIPMVESGTLHKADLAMLALFSLAAFEVVMPLPAALQAYGETLAAAQRLFEIVEHEVPLKSPSAPAPLPDRFDIRIQQVTFTYPGTKQPALQNIDLTVPHGGRLTLRGRSGSGKSSLIQLLVRFYEPQQGHISLGGLPLRDWDIEQLRSQLAVVSQQTHLFTGTIRDNLLIANPQADDQALQQACRIAQIHDFISSLPESYETWVGEAGATLSGGQARRIAIARAMLKDAPVLLLDEPTEGLDATTATRLLEAIDHAAADKTVILITHRAIGCDDFAPTLVMENGQLQQTPIQGSESV
jgi:ATP-binding cassette subfamily C protein CydC